MFDKLKMKFAAQRVKRTHRNRRTQAGFVARVWEGLCGIGRDICTLLRMVWGWLCRIDVVGLLNLALLAAIVVLFSMLIIDVAKYRYTTKTVVPTATLPHITTEIQDTSDHTRAERTLPLKRDAKTNKPVSQPIQVVHVTPNKVAERQIARTDATKLYGDIIIDNRDMRGTIARGATVHGNLYLQNMRKFVLPCDVTIEGNLFLRDLGLLQFCGDFTVRGNIYVSPRSSFGPIPSTARIGGQVIL